MSMRTVLGWSRDKKGKIRNRHPSDICNAITSMCAGGHSGEDGLGNTTPYILEVYEQSNNEIL